MTQKQVNEGELKKRIKEDQSAFYILKDDVTNWIDEAKREFPQTTPQLEKQYPETWESELNSLRLHWFKKWFGDPI